jgi:microcystin-dependent protein
MRNRFLTPNATDLTSPSIRRLFVCPSELTKYLTGALDVLCHGYNWEMFGDASTDDTTQLFEEVIASMRDENRAGEIFASVSSQHDGALSLDGAYIDPNSYPMLAAVVPASWWVSSDEIELPNMTGAYLTGMGDSSQHGMFTGSNTHTLTVDEIPSHSHAYASAGTGAATLVVPDVPTAVPAPGATGLSGGNMAHNNRPLSLQVYWFIRYE